MQIYIIEVTIASQQLILLPNNSWTIKGYRYRNQQKQAHSTPVQMQREWVETEVLFNRVHTYPLQISISIRRGKERVKKKGRGEEGKWCAFQLLNIMVNHTISITTEKQVSNAHTPHFSVSVVYSSLEAYINVSMHFCRREGMIDWPSSFSSSSSPKSYSSPFAIWFLSLSFTRSTLPSTYSIRFYPLLATYFWCFQW